MSHTLIEYGHENRNFELTRRTMTNRRNATMPYMIRSKIPGLTNFLRMVKRSQLKLKVNPFNYYWTYKAKTTYEYRYWDLDNGETEYGTNTETLGKLYIYPDTHYGHVDILNPTERTNLSFNFRWLAYSIIRKKFLPVWRKRRFMKRFNKSFPEIARARANLKKRLAHERICVCLR